MAKRPKRIAAVTASVLALAMILGGTALASKTKVHPTLTLEASRGANNSIIAQGVYDNVSSACRGPGGRTVFVSARNFSTSTTTNSSGSYFTQFGDFHHGKVVVHAFVPGDVSGGYRHSVICFDASARDTVRFSGGGCRDHDNDGDCDPHGGHDKNSAKNG
jgi:hypothetical protein